MRTTPHTRGLLLVCVLVLPVFALASPPETQPAPSTTREAGQWRQEGKDLTNSLLRLQCAKTILTLTLLGGLLARERAARLRDALRCHMKRTWVADGFFFGIVATGLHVVVSLFGWFDYLVLHAYGQTTELPSRWLQHELTHLFLTGLLVPPLALLGYGIIRRLPGRWWWFLALGVVPVNLLVTVVGPYYADAVHVNTPLPPSQLRQQILSLTRSAGITIENIYVEPTSKTGPQPRAYVTGIGLRKRIVLSDNLLHSFAPDEIVFATAHEIGHHALGHIWIDIAVGAVTPVAVLYLLAIVSGQPARETHDPNAEKSGKPPLLCRIPLLRRRTCFARPSAADPVSFPYFILILSVLGILSRPAKNAMSRWMEQEADRYALECTVLTRVPVAAPVQLFEKIGSLALLDPRPHWFVKVFFFPHPPIDERIAFCHTWVRAKKLRSDIP